MRGHEGSKKSQSSFKIRQDTRGSALTRKQERRPGTVIAKIVNEGDSDR